MASDVSQIRTRGAYEAQVPLGNLLEDAGRIEGMLDQIATRRKMLRILAGVVFLAGIVDSLCSTDGPASADCWPLFLAWPFLFIPLFMARGC